MTATIEFLLESATDVLKVPNSALRFKPTADMVAEVKPQLEEQMKNLPDSVKKRIIQRLEGGGSNRSQSGGSGGFSGGQSFGGSGGGRDGSNNSNSSRRMSMLWYFDSNGKLKVARVKTGITDGQMTEISTEDNSIKPGIEVINE